MVPKSKEMEFTQEERELFPNICVEIKNIYHESNTWYAELYRGFVREEGRLYWRLKKARELYRDKDLIDYIQDEISENFNAQIEILKQIRKNQKKMRD